MEGPEEEEGSFFEKDDQVVEEVGCTMSAFYRREVIDVIQAFTRYDGERREPIRSEDGDFWPIRGQEGDLRLADKLTQTEVTLAAHLAGLARFRTEMIVDQSWAVKIHSYKIQIE